MPRKPRGISERAVKPGIRPREVVEAPFVACPVCGLSRKLEKSGNWARLRHRLDETKPMKGRVHFGNFDLNSGFLIQIRDSSGSRGHGFPLIGGYTIEELKEKAEFDDLLAELKNACIAILDKLA